MIFDLKTKIVVISTVVIIIGTFFTLWRVTDIKLNSTREQLTEVTCKLDTVTKENARLVEYNKQRDTKIKVLEKEYQAKLNSIPADLCGDMKPSKKMIEFFKKGE